MPTESALFFVRATGRIGYTPSETMGTRMGFGGSGSRSPASVGLARGGRILHCARSHLTEEGIRT